ncbi:MAG: lactate utilization protein [Planctomycetes bacterium]|nr:lactate utilization protein [Planctomycetota bacterium]
MSSPPRIPAFHRDAGRFLADDARVGWHDQALWHLRAKRDKAAAATPDWEALRDHAAALKAHVLDQLPELWTRFSANARAAGWTVHFAADAAEMRATVHGLLTAAGVRRVVKSKSMLSEECGLNPHLEAHGFEVVDTDLGERIVQLRHEPPSHIVVPAIHLKRAEVGELFHRELGTPAGLDDPTALAHAARADLRRRFLAAEAGITGVNIAVAETGAMVVCTNEGNADLGTALPPLHIAVVGAEKVVPTLDDAGVLLRLLARSATGQPITSYTTHLAGPDPRRPGHACHLVVVDNGRSRLAADEHHRRALSCIRCGACLNTCPVYRRASGHAYGTVIPGPIGAVLAPAMIGTAAARALPFASSLCGSCTQVCPVRIDLHDQLLAWRRQLADEGLVPLSKRLAMRAGAWFLAHPRLFAAGGWLGRRLGFLARLPIPGPHRLWLRHRGMPDLPADSFRAQWKNRHG